jgi:23S rRNA (adenine-N6)-dimethyltransferase
VAVRRPPAGAPGQHFLRSSRLAAALVREADVRPGDRVVEIGAGTGVLTRALASAGAMVTALELDPRLASRLRQAQSIRDIAVVEVDVLRWSWPSEAFAVVANLPFARSGAILSHLLGDPAVNLRRADVIVQWELAVKQTAVWPATLKSTYWRAWYDLSVAGRLARSAFSPTPGVDAAVLRVTRRPRPLVRLEEHDAYWRFLADAFRHARPVATLSRPLSRLQVKRLAPVLGFAPDASARDLDARQWAALFAYVRGDQRTA